MREMRLKRRTNRLHGVKTDREHTLKYDGMRTTLVLNDHCFSPTRPLVLSEDQPLLRHRLRLQLAVAHLLVGATHGDEVST